MIASTDWITFGIVELGVRIIAIFYAANAIMHVRTSQGAVAWVISILIFPYVALPLYWVFGRRKFHGYAEAQRAAIAKADTGLHDKIFQALQDYQAPLSPGLAPLQTLCQRITHFGFTTDNDMQLLINGDATFTAILAAINSAKDYILMQFFIVKDDKIGNQVRLKLIEKAQQGVRVYFMYDEIGSHKLSHCYIESMRQSGVEVNAFHTRKGKGNRWQINFRNHRKLVIIDGKTGFMGGLNLADEYRGLGKKFGYWRDTFLQLSGPCILQLQISIVRDWHWATNEILNVSWQPQPHNSDQIAAVLPIGPADPFTSGTLLFMEIIQLAKKRLWIASPYFVPESAILASLQLAALRGVDIRILLPSRPDHKLIYLCGFSYYDALQQAGIHVYRYRQGFMHQKAFLVDDQLAGVGTVNLDNRSLRINFELMGLFADDQSVIAIENMLKTDIAASKKIDLSSFQKRHYLFRLLVRSAKLFAPIL